MKRKLLIGLVCLKFISLTGCGSNSQRCSISGCENEVYKEGLCPDHYVESMTVKTELDTENEEAKENSINDEIVIDETGAEGETTIDDKTDELSAEKLEEVLLQQPCYVKRTRYIVQEEDKQYKTLYPDILSAIIKNNAKTEIKSVVVAFAAWDKNNLPIKLIGQYDFSGGSYVQQCNFEDVNLLNGETFGKNSGMAINKDTADIEEFKAIVVSYTDFDENIWENPYYENWLSVYENQKLE